MHLGLNGPSLFPTPERVIPTLQLTLGVLSSPIYYSANLLIPVVNLIAVAVAATCPVCLMAL